MRDLHVICHTIITVVFSVAMTASGVKYSETGPKFDRKVILVMIWRLIGRKKSRTGIVIVVRCFSVSLTAF